MPVTPLTDSNPLTRPWLLLATGAIGLSALFAVLLVVARTPLLQQLFGGADLFHTVLVLHVNFSVLIWLLAFGAVVWSLAIRRLHPLVDPLAFGLVIAGALLISLSPLLTPPPQPVMSNYIPILHSPAFLTGLCAFAAGIGLYALRRLAAPADDGSGARSGRLAALGLVVSMLLFAVTAWRLPQPLDSPAAFEVLFWGGGHLLQFVYLLLLISCWQMLQGKGLPPLAERLLGVSTLLLYAVALGLALLLEPGSAAYRDGFTQLMRYGTPLLALPAVILLWSPRGVRGTPGLRLSQILLLAGLLLGLLISGDNVSVTAHYHATNAAITLAFMALAYRLFAQLGLGQVEGRWARRQLRLYFAGMVIYVSGMALSGQLNVPRKVALTTEGQEALAMGLMGLGGLIAILATLLFVALQLHAIIRHQPSPARRGEQHETPS
jgi:cytochrome c oxidase subunit 1